MSVYLYGSHAVKAALSNPKRIVHKIFCIDSKKKELQDHIKKQNHTRKYEIQIVNKEELDKYFSSHQGMLLETEVLISDMKNLESEENILLLDKVQDLRNIGALIRSAAVFNFKAMIVSVSAQCPNIFERYNYAQIGKAACGALEHIKLITVKNIANTLDELKKRNFWIIGLDESGENISQALQFEKICLVVGQEGEGLKHLTKQKCDLICCLKTSENFSCLNASVAAGIGMYELFKR